MNIQFIAVGDATQNQPAMAQQVLETFTQHKETPMASDQPAITVEVSGPPDSGKSLVCNIINRALTKSGFTACTVTDQQGAVVEPPPLMSILDTIKASRPQLFATPIDIQETTEVEIEGGDDSTLELSDMTLRLDDEDDYDDIDQIVASEGEYGND